MNYPMLAFFGPIGLPELVILAVVGLIVVAIIVGVIVAVVVRGKGQTTSTNVPPAPKPDQDSPDAPSQ